MFNFLQVTFLALAVVAAPYSVAGPDGNKLLQQLQSTSDEQNLYAYNYIMGVVDYEQVVLFREVSVAALPGAKGQFTVNLFCLPDAGNGKQIFDIVTQYLEKNPEKRHQYGVILVRNALLAVWPCRGNFVPDTPTKK